MPQCFTVSVSRQLASGTYGFMGEVIEGVYKVMYPSYNSASLLLQRSGFL